MATLNLKVSTTGEEFAVPDIDFSTVTPQQIIDTMRNQLPSAGQGMGWKLLKGSQVINQNESLESLGFQDDDTAQLMAKVEGAIFYVNNKST